MSGRVTVGPVTRRISVGRQYVGEAVKAPNGAAWTFKLAGVADPAVMMLNGNVYNTLDSVVRAVEDAARKEGR